MNTIDLRLFRILLAACSFGFVLFYFFPYLLALPMLVLLGAWLKGGNLD